MAVAATANIATLELVPIASGAAVGTASTAQMGTFWLQPLSASATATGVAATAPIATIAFSALPSSAASSWMPTEEYQAPYARPRTRTCSLADATANSSNKVLGVSEIGIGSFEISSVRVDYTASATAGNRVLVVEIADADGTIAATIPSTLTITANQTKIVQFTKGIASTTIGGVTYDPMPDGLLAVEGQTIRVYDSGGIDDAADDMTVHIVGRG